ncbi:MAG: hypothetical protein ACR2Q4_21215 [Geminicoccaceae bacterium]
MIRLLLHCLCSFAFAMAATTTAMAQRLNDADRLWFAVTIEPDYVLTEGAYVGGEMVMHIRLMSPDTFQRLRLDLPDIEGARAETLVRPHMRQLSSLGAMGYSDAAGYSYEARLAIVPERSGTILIPPIRVTGISQPGEGQAFEFRKTFPEQTVTVHPSSPEFDGDHWLVSRMATIEDSWSPEIASIQNGDTVHRRVVLSVAGIVADDLPELTLRANDGYRVLSTGVSAETEKTDEGFIAHLEQSWDIYVETEDVIHIDGFRFPYWNPELARTEIASLPRQRVEPLPKNALALREQLREEVLARHRTKSLGLVFLLSLPAAALLIILALALWRALPTRADIKLWRASHQAADAPLKFYPSFLSWCKQALGTRTIVSQNQIATLGARATDQVDDLHRSIFGSHGDNVETKQIATTLVWASRRMIMRTLFSRVFSNLSRFLFPR